MATNNDGNGKDSSHNNASGDSDPCDKMLSTKAEIVAERGLGIMGRIKVIGYDAYHPVTNPKGFVKMAIAENKVCEDLLVAKMAELSKQPDPTSTFYYGNPRGNIEFRRALKRFFTKYFKPLHPIDEDSIFVTSGATPIIETLSFAFCNPGEYMMILSPYYHRMDRDVGDRPGVCLLPVPSSFWNPATGLYDADIRAEVLEGCYQKATCQGKKIRAIQCVNPNNPTGDVFTVDQINVLLNFANRHELHVLCNEIYGLTVFDPEAKFTSVLSLPLADPGRVHFGWGFSKGFGTSGYNVGALITRNPRLQKYLDVTSIFTKPVHAMQHKFTQLISDEDWLDNVFLPVQMCRLRERLEGVQKALTPLGVKVHKSSAALFAWLDMSKFLPSRTEEGESWLTEQFVAGGVLIMPGTTSEAPAYGLFRMLITTSQEEHAEGLQRMTAVILNLLKRQQNSSEH